MEQHAWEDRLLEAPRMRRRGALIFVESVHEEDEPGLARRIAAYVVDRVYLGHNRSRNVKRALARLSAQFEHSGGLGLNFGSGGSARRPNFVNVDVCLTSGVDVVYDGGKLPFKDETFDLVISQEVFEHIPDCYASLAEVSRVTRKGASFYLQLPFTIGYHGAPHDYWRFSVVGIEKFVESLGTFKVLEKGMAVGHGTGLYRILVEFFATTASVFGSIFYRPTKLACAILFVWVKLFDLLTPLASEPDRIAGGYYVIAQRI